MADTSPIQWLLTGAVRVLGLWCSIRYLLRRPDRAAGLASQNALLTGPRPWRRMGAAIVALLAVMFFLGANFITPRLAPPDFALFWLLMLLLVLWLCLLVWVDIHHTRRLTSDQLTRDDDAAMSASQCGHGAMKESVEEILNPQSAIHHSQSVRSSARVVPRRRLRAQCAQPARGHGQRHPAY